MTDAPCWLRSNAGLSAAAVVQVRAMPTGIAEVCDQMEPQIHRFQPYNTTLEFARRNCSPLSYDHY
jgi:hypothetical protein